MSDKVCAICKKKPPYSKQAKYCRLCLKTKEAVILKVNACNHRAKKMGAAGTFTVAEWKALCDKYGKKCLKCCRRGDYHTLTPDHIVSMSVGGTNYIDNIQPFCQPCNSSKFNKTIDYRNADHSRHDHRPDHVIHDLIGELCHYNDLRSKA